MATSARRVLPGVTYLTAPPEIEFRDGMVYFHLASGEERYCDVMSVHHYMVLCRQAEAACRAWREAQGEPVPIKPKRRRKAG